MDHGTFFVKSNSDVNHENRTITMYKAFKRIYWGTASKRVLKLYAFVETLTVESNFLVFKAIR